MVILRAWLQWAARMARLMCTRRWKPPVPHLPPLPLTHSPAASTRCVQGATGPVHAVLSENMAAYHFWSTEAHRWEVASLELYEASPSTLK